jgi:hypothetical protein
MDLTSAVWRKSSYSGANGGNCVEVAQNVPGLVGVRDSKDPRGSALTLSPKSWADFMRSIKDGEFDL